MYIIISKARFKTMQGLAASNLPFYIPKSDYYMHLGWIPLEKYNCTALWMGGLKLELFG